MVPDMVACVVYYTRVDCEDSSEEQSRPDPGRIQPVFCACVTNSLLSGQRALALFQLLQVCMLRNAVEHGLLTKTALASATHPPAGVIIVFDTMNGLVGFMS
jgi:hypothetical protein